MEIKLYGPELAALEQYGAHLATALESVDGLEDVYDGVSEPAAELEMHVNGAEADKVGLTPAAVSEAVSGALLGVSAGEMHLADRALAVRVRAPDAIRFDPRAAELAADPAAGRCASGAARFHRALRPDRDARRALA